MQFNCAMGVRFNTDEDREPRFPSGPVRTRQDPSGPVRTLQDPSGPIRTHQDPSGPLRTPQDPSGPIRIPQDPSGPLRTHQDPSGPLRTLQDPGRRTPGSSETARLAASSEPPADPPGRGLRAARTFWSCSPDRIHFPDPSPGARGPRAPPPPHGVPEASSSRTPAAGPSSSSPNQRSGNPPLPPPLPLPPPHPPWESDRGGSVSAGPGCSQRAPVRRRTPACESDRPGRAPASAPGDGRHGD